MFACPGDIATSESVSGGRRGPVPCSFCMWALRPVVPAGHQVPGRRACARTGCGGADLAAVRWTGARAAGDPRDSVSSSFAACQLLVATEPTAIGLLIPSVHQHCLLSLDALTPPAATTIDGPIIKGLDSKKAGKQGQAKNRTAATKTSPPGPSSSPRPTRLRRNNSLMKRRPAGGPPLSHLGPLQIIPPASAHLITPRLPVDVKKEGES